MSKFSVFRTLTVAKRVLRQIIRDKRTFGMIIMMPILIMLVFGIALSGEVKNVPVTVDNLDTGAGQLNIGASILTNLQNDDRVKVRVASYASGIDKVEKGDYSASIQLPADLSELLAKKAQGIPVKIIIKVYIDATKPAIKGSILGALQGAISDALGEQGVEIEQELAFNGAENTGLDVAIPAVMGFVLTFLVLLLSLLTLIRETIGGTLNRLYTTPLTKIERLLGYVLALSFFGFIEVAVILAISTAVFGAIVKGSFILLLITAFLYALVHVLLSVFLSNFTENELQAVQMAPLIGLPSMALSGMLVPVDSLPESAIFLSKFFPLTYGIRLFEGIMLKGFGFADLLYEYAILLVFIVILFVLSLLTVEDHMKD